MIRYLRIKNFQSHRRSLFTFKSGLNIIRGQSNSGKSAMLRALRWLFLNRPRGVSFKSWFAGKKDAVVVQVGLSDSDTEVALSRKRSGKVNAYYVGGDEYKALGSDVPQEVIDVSNVMPINIHSQHDGYFLLQESSGKVASELAKLVDLDIVDRVYSAVNRKILSTRSDIEHLSADLVDVEEQLKVYEVLPEFCDVVDNVIFTDQYLCDLMDASAELCKLIDTRVSIESQIKQVSVIFLCADSVDELDVLVGTYRILKCDVQSLEDLVLSYSRAVVSKKHYHTYQLKMVDLLRNAYSVVEMHKRLETDVIVLQKAIRKWESLEGSMERARGGCIILEDEIAALWASCDVCPVCGQEVTRGQEVVHRED